MKYFWSVRLRLPTNDSFLRFGFGRVRAPRKKNIIDRRFVLDLRFVFFEKVCPKSVAAKLCTQYHLIIGTGILQSILLLFLLLFVFLFLAITIDVVVMYSPGLYQLSSSCSMLHKSLSFALSPKQ